METVGRQILRNSDAKDIPFWGKIGKITIEIEIEINI